MDITTPPLPAVAPEVLRVAEHRHKKGLMYPYIYHVLTKVRASRTRLVAALCDHAGLRILTVRPYLGAKHEVEGHGFVFQGEIKLSVTIEDEANKDLPSAVQLYRPIRQYVYGVLFSLAEAKKKAERLAMRRNRLPECERRIPAPCPCRPPFVPHTLSFCPFFPMTDPPVIVKEWAAYKGKSPHTPELVEALPFREWTCPNLKKLWLGKAVEDKNRRMRAFLACMRSDTPAMLNPANVPTPLMVLCCVLR